MSSKRTANRTIGTWKRRAITLPVLGLLLVSSTALLPLSLTLVGLLDAVLPGWKWARVRTVLAAQWIILCEALGIAAAFALWLLYLAHRNDTRFHAHNAALQRRWTEALFRGAMRLFSLELEVEGRECATEGPYLLFLRHCSTLDTVLAATLVANPFKIIFRYVLKDELLCDPCLDVVGSRMNNAFVSRGKALRERDLERVRSLAKDLGEGEGILLYPEGTRFTPRKLERALERLRESAAPQLLAAAEGLRHMLPPRRGGATTLLQEAPELDLVFLVHTGLERSVRVSDFWNGELVGQTLKARLHRVPAASIPRGEDEQLQWLMQQWLELDAWLDAHTEQDIDEAA